MNAVGGLRGFVANGVAIYAGAAVAKQHTARGFAIRRGVHLGGFQGVGFLPRLRVFSKR